MSCSMASTMNHKTLLTFVVCLILTASTRGAELSILPSTFALTGPQVGQRVIVVSQESGKIVGDVTGDAKFGTSNPAVATINESGMVKAVGDGEATITAIVDGK